MHWLKSVSPRQWLAIAAVMAVVSALTLLLRDAVRDLVVIPVTYLIWIADIFIRSVPQSIQLIVAVGIATLAALRALAAGRARAEAPPIPPQPRFEQSRLGLWSRHLHGVDDSAYAAEKLAHELRGMIIGTLSSDGRIDREEVVARARAGELDAPPEVRDVITGIPAWLKIQPTNPITRAIRDLRARWHPDELPPGAAEMARALSVVTAYVESLGGGRKKEST